MKSDKKSIIIFVISFILFMGIEVSAQYIFFASSVSFDNENYYSNNLQSAIDELYSYALTDSCDALYEKEEKSNVSGYNCKKIPREKYYKYGIPDKNSSTDYQTMDTKVYASLYSDNSTYGICTIYNEEQYCFSLKYFFRELISHDEGLKLCDSSSRECTLGNIVCRYTNNSLECEDTVNHNKCYTLEDQSVTCE